MSRITPGFGLVLLDPRLTTSSLTAKGSGTRDSAYTESGPMPGTPDPDDAQSAWRPQASRAQSVELDLYTIKGGYAGREGAEVLYRLATDTDAEDYRGWQDPVIVSGFTAGISAGATGTRAAASAWDNVHACVTPDGMIVIAAVDDSLASGRVWKYNARTGVWTDGQDFSAGTPGLEGPIGLCYDTESERTLLYSGASSSTGLRQAGFKSTDDGVTFSPFTRRSLGGSLLVGYDTGAFRIAVRPGLDWLMMAVSATDGTGNTTQFASSDKGATWEFIDTASTTLPGAWPVWTGSAFLVAYVNASAKPCVKIVASARANVDDAAEIEVDGTRDARNVIPVVDADGTIYLYAQGVSTGTHLDELACYRSVDGGLTFDRYECDVYAGGSTTTEWYEWGAAIATCGAVYLIGIGKGNTGTDNTVGVLRLGGYSQVAHGGGAGGITADHVRRVGWGGSTSGTTIEARTVFPIGPPDTHGFSVLSALGTLSLTQAGYDAFYFNLTTGNALEWRYTASTAKLSVMFEGEFYVATGGLDTRANCLAGGRNAYVLLRLSDASSYEYDVYLHICSDGIALEDGNGGADLESIALTMNGTSGGAKVWTRIRVLLVAGRVDWWYAQGTGDMPEVWTKGTGAVVSNGGAFPTQSRCDWGATAAFASNTTFGVRWLGVAFGGEWQNGVEAVSAWDESYTAGIRGHVYGRPLPGRSTPYPLPELTTDSEDVGLISASGGPTYLGETVSMAPAYTFAVGSVHATLSPSPRDRWRQTGTTEVKLVYDLATAQWYGDGLALLVVNARPAQWILETDDGSTGWTVQGTLDLTFGSSLTYTRTGSVVVPNGGSSVARYLRENELAGGYVVSNSVAAAIESHPAGWWGGSSRQQVRLTLTSVGSFPSSGSDLSIVAPSGMLIVYPTSAVLRRYVRIRAAASAVVPGSVYTAGILALGRVVGIGADPAWTWSSERRLSVRRSRSSDGVTLARELGPVSRRITYGWPEYQDMRELRLAANYVAESSGLPIGTGEDSATLPELLSTIESGEVPVVLVPRLPTSSGTTLLDREAFIYGRVMNDSLAVQGKLGTEGVDEWVTVGGLSVDELV